MDDLLGGVDPGAETADHLAVDRHPAVTDHVLARPAAGDARLGEDLLQPDAAGNLGGVALVDVVAVVEVGVTPGLAGGLETVVLDRARPELGLLRGAAPASLSAASGRRTALAVRARPLAADRLDLVALSGPAEPRAGTAGRLAPAALGAEPAAVVPARSLRTEPTAIVTTRTLGTEPASIVPARSVGTEPATVIATRTLGTEPASIVTTRTLRTEPTTVVTTRSVGTEPTALRATVGPAEPPA
ncbi:hypothetical protein GCM10017600_43730 [Streptosporangium carneum]|uniref:Uncharacterized protein n=1 Tax=Streptosporangium carneum TaxID=47481 RepID=A0A9W6I2R4_9ACTN|nr:hypothetical protein GCM10017600_43730 [Streptosporangium carneum]